MYTYIDKQSIIEYFEEEFDLTEFSNNDWNELDEMVGADCEEYHIEPDFTMTDEEYVDICRDCIDALMGE